MKFILSSMLIAGTLLLGCSDNASTKTQKFLDTENVNKSELDATKVEWIDVSPSEGRLVSFFNDATITTYFKKTDRKNFFHRAIPIKQEFVYHPTQQVFISTDLENRLWDDGVSGYSFRYKDITLEADGTKYKEAFVTINDVFDAFEARYTLYEQ